jgi:hypothetical protein
MDWIARENRLKDTKGRDCDDKAFVSRESRIHPNQNLIVPEGNELVAPSLVTIKCPKAKPVPPEAPATPFVPVVVPPAPEPDPTLRKIYAQAIPQSDGTLQQTARYDRVDFLVGRPPQDAGAELSMVTAKRTPDGALAPMDSEGTKVRMNRGKIVMDRTTYSEIEYRPGYHAIVDRSGMALRANEDRPQKIFEGPRLAIDADGNQVTVVSANAVISLPRRLNPNYSGFIREEDMAEVNKQISKWANSGEGAEYAVTLVAAEREYNRIATDYFAGKSSNQLADAQKLIELNIQQRMHPIVWSINSHGVPVLSPEDTKNNIKQVLAQLSPADRAELESRYNQYIPALGDAVKLAEMTAGTRDSWHNPVKPWAIERAREGFIRDGYEHYTADASAEQSAMNYALEQVTPMWNRSIRAPYATEIALGRGEILNPARQNAPAMITARALDLQQMIDDPAYLASVADDAVTTQGKLEKWTNPVYFATRPDDANPSIVGVERENEGPLLDWIGTQWTGIVGGRGTGREAREFNRQVSDKLFGNKVDVAEKLNGERPGWFRRNILGVDDPLMYKTPNLGDNIIREATHFPSIGLVSVFNGMNMNVGVGEGLRKIVADRLADPKTRPEVLEGFRLMAERAKLAQDKGVDIFASSATLSRDPNADEDAGRGAQSYTGQSARGRANQRMLATDQMVVNQNEGAGNTPGALETAVKVETAAGNLVKDTPAAWKAAVTEAEKAVASGDPKQVARVMQTATNPQVVTQNQINQNNVVELANASPAMFSLAVATGMANSTLAVEDNAHRVGENSNANPLGIFGRTLSGEYVDLLGEHASYIAAAKANGPAAEAKAIQRAMAAFNSHFASGQSRHAVNNMAGEIARDPALTAQFTSHYSGLSNGDGAVTINSVLNKMVDSGQMTAEKAQEAKLSFLALQTSSDKAAGFASWQQTFIGAINANKAGPGISVIELVKLGLTIYQANKNPKTPDIPLGGDNPGTCPNPRGCGGGGPGTGF